MNRARTVTAVLLACALGALLTACGDDEGGETPERGTCDLRDVDSYCIELHGANSTNLDAQEDACLDAGGSWSNDECPTELLVGCCDYTLGNDFHQCFYEGTARDPEAYCMMFDDGVYTPAD